MGSKFGLHKTQLFFHLIAYYVFMNQILKYCYTKCGKNGWKKHNEMEIKEIKKTCGRKSGSFNKTIKVFCPKKSLNSFVTELQSSRN